MTTANFLFAQLQPFSLSGAGVTAGSTTIILSSFAQINGTLLTMADFGAKGYATLEPGNSTLEEQISFTGVTQNTNGTATLTGVHTVLMVSPYTESSGLAQTHAGATPFVISNTSGFYNNLVAKDDDATITGKYTFPNGANTPLLGVSYVAPTLDTQAASKKYVDTVAVFGAPLANPTTAGIVQEATQAQVDAGTQTGSTGADLFPTPAILRSRSLSDYVADTGAADAYVITPSPAISAYVAGQRFTFKVAHANTTNSTLAVSGLSATAILRSNDSTSLVVGDLLVGQIVEVEYNGINGFAMMSPPGTAALSTTQKEIYATSVVGTDSYAITPSPAITAYTTGQSFFFKADVANTGSASLAVSGLSSTLILKRGNVALVTGDILAGQIIEVVYDSVFGWQMQTPVSLGLYKNGNTTKNAADASTTQVIAHGLGTIPKRVSIVAIAMGSTAVPLRAEAVYNGTTQSSVTIYENSSGPTYAASNGFTLNAGAADSANTEGVVTVDVTNINIAWTKTGSPTGTYQILWTAEA